MKKLVLQCTKCLEINYKINNNKSTKIMRINKFCKHCNERSLHIETK